MNPFLLSLPHLLWCPLHLSSPLLLSLDLPRHVLWIHSPILTEDMGFHPPSILFHHSTILCINKTKIITHQSSLIMLWMCLLLQNSIFQLQRNVPLLTQIALRIFWIWHLTFLAQLTMIWMLIATVELTLTQMLVLMCLPALLHPHSQAPFYLLSQTTAVANVF